MDRIFTCGKVGNVVVFQRNRSALGHSIIIAVHKRITVIQYCHSISVQSYIKRNIRIVPSCKTYRFGNCLRISVNHHSFRIDDLYISACIRHSQINIRLLVCLNIKTSSALRKCQLCPVTGNRLFVGKCCLRKQIFHPGKSTAVIACSYRYILRLFEEVFKGYGIQKRIKFICTDFNFCLRWGNIRNTLDSNGHVAIHTGNNECITGFVTCSAVNLHVIYKNLIVFSLRITVCNLYFKLIIRAMTCSVRTGNGIARSTRQNHSIKFPYSNGDTCSITRNVRRHDRMLCIIRCNSIFSIFRHNGIAIHCHSKVVGIGNGKFHRTVISFAVFNTGNNRCFTVRRFHITTATEFFVRIGIPYTGVGMADHSDIPCDTYTTVDNLIKIYILKCFSIGKTLHQRFTGNSDLSECSA